MRLPALVLPADLPAADARIPAVAVRVMVLALGTLLSIEVYGTSGWLAVGILFSALAAWQPDYLLAWLVIIFLALGQLGHQPALSWQFLILLAGTHLLHVLASLTLLLPWRAWVQPAVFTGPLLRFTAIQLPVQLAAIVALLLLAPNAHGRWPLSAPEFTIVGAAALACLALLLLAGAPPKHAER